MTPPTIGDVWNFYTEIDRMITLNGFSRGFQDKYASLSEEIENAIAIENDTTIEGIKNLPLKTLLGEKSSSLFFKLKKWYERATTPIFFEGK